MFMNIRSLTRCALMAALLCVLSPVSIPLASLVPISLASLMVMLAGSVLGRKEGVIAVLIYLLCGMAGLPVFAEFSSGITVLFGVTGGFLFGYLPLAYCSGLFYENGKDTRSLLTGTILGTVILYTIGTLWFMFYLKTDLLKALAACVLPFLIGDALKIFLVCLLTPRLQAAIRRWN